MTTLGLNVKMTIAPEHRPRVRAVFVDILGATPVSPMPDLEVYKLDDGASIGAYYPAGAEALGTADQRKGAWLEFGVRDPQAVADKLEATGVARVEYADKTHAYFQLPGGPVFRLAKNGN